MELGIYTFAEKTPDPRTGRTVSSAQRLRDLLEKIQLADQVGLDVFGVVRREAARRAAADRQPQQRQPQRAAADLRGWTRILQRQQRTAAAD